MTQLKAGFLFSGRAGSGVIIARLADGSWSAPSAIVTAGAGVGGQIGAELTDFVFILNTQAAVDTFSQAGSITLGGNVSVAVGPIGRNAEAAGSASLKSVAAIFAYSKTKGLFAGVSLEGSALIERRDANQKFYGPGATAKKILSGRVENPPECDILFRVLDSRAFGTRGRDMYDDDDEIYNDIPNDFDSDDNPHRQSSRSTRSTRGTYGDYDDDNDDNDYGRGRGGRGSPSYRSRSNSGEPAPSYFKSKYSDSPNSNNSSSGRNNRNNRNSSSRNSHNSTDNDHNYSSSRRPTDAPHRPSAAKPNFSTRPHRASDAPERYDRERQEEQRLEGERRHEASQQGEKAVALFSFSGEKEGDLGFRKGDIITILQRTGKQDDWWTGRKGASQGIFPANYVELV